MRSSKQGPRALDKTQRVDVLVVGLGPAGAMAAAAAARAGACVLGVDRKAQAGIPVQCAEFVPAMIGPMLGRPELAAFAASRCQTIMAMACQIEDYAFDVKENFPGFMIDRAAFDAALVAAAIAAGAACDFGARLAAIAPDGTALLSDGRAIDATVIIGADGPRSRVGLAIGQGNPAIAETRQITVPLHKPHHATDIFLAAGITGGYGWLFPKGNTANLGLGVEQKQRHQLKPLLAILHDRLVRDERIGSEILNTTGGAIPVGGLRRSHGRAGGQLVLLAGDAAGLTNPATGAGINAAVISGRMAGEAAVRALGGDAGSGAAYHEDLDELFGASLNRALTRRRELLAVYSDGESPTPEQLRRGWIAYPQYWSADKQLEQPVDVQTN